MAMSTHVAEYHSPMRYGICLPNFTDVASAESIEATAELRSKRSVGDALDAELIRAEV